MEIKDKAGYNEKMRLGIIDKAWFISEYAGWNNIRTIVDFGCADGALIQVLKICMPEKEFIGVDNSDFMRDVFSKNTGCRVFESLDDLLNNYPLELDKTALILGSVIHEVYSYSPEEEEIARFWDNVKKFKVVAIREMLLPSDGVVCASEWVRKNVRNNWDREYEKQLVDHERIWGRIDAPIGTAIGPNGTKYDVTDEMDTQEMEFIPALKSFMKLMLSFTYTKNWERELLEDYLPLSKEDYEQIADDMGMKIKFEWVGSYGYFKAIYPGLKYWDEVPDTHIRLLLER